MNVIVQTKAMGLKCHGLLCLILKGVMTHIHYNFCLNTNFSYTLHGISLLQEFEICSTYLQKQVQTKKILE